MADSDQLDRFWSGKKVWRYAFSEGLLVFKITFAIIFAIRIFGWILNTERPFLLWISGSLILASSLGLIFSIPMVFLTRLQIWKNNKAVQK